MMKVKLLSPLGTLERSYTAGEVFETTDEAAIRMIANGLAEPTNKKAYEAAVKKIEDTEAKREEEEAKVRAILEKEAIELELRELYGKVADKEAELAGTILDDEQRSKMVEALENREK